MVFESVLYSGHLTDEEKIVLVNAVSRGSSASHILITWASDLLMMARVEQRLSDSTVQIFLFEISDFRKGLDTYIGYGRLHVPLAYTQVLYLPCNVTVAFSSQFIMHIFILGGFSHRLWVLAAWSRWTPTHFILRDSIVRDFHQISLFVVTLGVG